MWADWHKKQGHAHRKHGRSPDPLTEQLQGDERSLSFSVAPDWAIDFDGQPLEI
jgi:hypothetical protein